MEPRVDCTDREIIACLREDARMPSSEIARRIGGLSERAVRYRIDRLVRQQIIRTTAIVNPSRIGFEVMADVWVEVEPAYVPEVARKLAAMQETSYVVCSTGERDIGVQVQARNNSELYAFVTEVIGNLPGVKKTTTMIVPLLLKDNYDWQIPLSACVDAKKDDQGAAAKERRAAAAR